MSYRPGDVVAVTAPNAYTVPAGTIGTVTDEVPSAAGSPALYLVDVPEARTLAYFVDEIALVHRPDPARRAPEGFRAGDLVRYAGTDGRTSALPGALARLLADVDPDDPLVLVQWTASASGRQMNGRYRVDDFEAFDGFEPGDAVTIAHDGPACHRHGFVVVAHAGKVAVQTPCGPTVLPQALVGVRERPLAERVLPAHVLRDLY